MQTLIAYIDDADFAAHMLLPMKSASEPTRWVLVTCPPRLSRHINRWVTHQARTQWRQNWSDKLLARLRSSLLAEHDRHELVIAQGCLTALTELLLQQHAGARVIDARRPKFGHPTPPLVSGQPAASDSALSTGGALAGLGVTLLLASD